MDREKERERKREKGMDRSAETRNRRQDCYSALPPGAGRGEKLR